jgi:hypothetical protein
MSVLVFLTAHQDGRDRVVVRDSKSMDRTVYDLEARFFLHTVARLVSAERSLKSVVV